MKTFINAIDRISGFGGWTAGVMMVIALVIAFRKSLQSVFGKPVHRRRVFGLPHGHAHVLRLAYTLRERGISG